MFVTPVPSIGDYVVGRDATGRVLRITSHPEVDRVVLSIWQEGRCLATVRLAGEDVPDLVRALTAAVVPEHLDDAPYEPRDPYDPYGPPEAEAG